MRDPALAINARPYRPDFRLAPGAFRPCPGLAGLFQQPRDIGFPFRHSLNEPKKLLGASEDAVSRI